MARVSCVAVVFLWGNHTAAQEVVRSERQGLSTAASRSVTGPVVDGVFRSKGANGEVEFNNFGNGEPVSLTVVPPASAAERALVEQRTQAAFDVAQVLSEDRQVRERARIEERQARLATAREEARRDARLAEWVAATQPRYYPIYLPRRPLANRHRPQLPFPEQESEVGPYQLRYRFPWRSDSE